ncbi:kinesin-domain-containing protein [Hanseniaspora valbyensis NRRL Y-1626]|uniref:Kinesin-domain-containing protein n=1 Tax=Hanseniaspora valbyensis NRRL Y-1626 TaxID=766949 RepID=A0A1B7TC60_9ASCO|nr:kinesin-domain-containing protein [Hanseniaspora valbyensis NRRL Y-1626]
MEFNNRSLSLSISSISSGYDSQPHSSQGSLKDNQNLITEKNNKNNVSSASEGDELNILVAVRCRGRNDREVKLKSPVVVTIPENELYKQSSYSNNKIKEVCLNLSDETGISAQLNSKKYLLDEVFGPDSKQDEIFKDIVEPLFHDFLKGFNCTVLCYGMTSTGKTYTMTGDEKLYNGELSSEAGIIPRVLFNLFENLNENKAKNEGGSDNSTYVDYLVKCSFIELYNEDLKDLLSSDSNCSINVEKKLKIYDSQNATNQTGLTSSSNIFVNDIKKRDASSTTLQRVNSFTQPTKSSLNGNYINNGKRISSQQETSSRKTSLTRSHRGIFIQNLEEFEITEPIEGLKLLQRGLKKRKVAATKMNDVSSRSHSIFSITLYKRVNNNDSSKPPGSNGSTSSINTSELFRVSKMNLVDLAGSENISRSGAINQRAKEAGSINQSLLTLGRVINALSDSKKGNKNLSPHIPFRESKLTRLLQDSLGGNTKTALIATISPAKVHLEETISTLEYASKAKNIKNKPQMGSVLFKDLLIKNVAVELSKLKNELYFTKQKEGGIYMEAEKYDSVHRDLENFKIEIQEYKRLNSNLKQQNKLLLLDKENLIDVRQRHERKISDLTKVIDYIYDKMDKQHKNEENLVDNAKQLISAINLMKDSISYYNSQKQQQTVYLKNLLIDSIPQIKNNLIDQLNKYGKDDKENSTKLIEQFKINLQKTFNEIITKTNTNCQDSLNFILNSSSLIAKDVGDKIQNIDTLIKSHIDLNTKDLMLISEYCNDCHDYLNDKINNNLNIINSQSTIKKLFCNLEAKNKDMLLSISNNVQQQFKQQQQDIINSISDITKSFHSIENKKFEPVNQKIQSVIKLINNSDYQNLSLNENCTKNLHDINTLVLDNKMLLAKKLKEFQDQNNYLDDSKNEMEIYDQIELIKDHLIIQNGMLDMNHEKNFDNNITLNNLSTKLENIINSTNNTDEKQIENETNLNNLLSAMENKNFKPIGSTGKTPMRPLLNSNNSYQDKSYNHDYSILQEKIGRMNNNRPNHDSEVSPLGNISNSSSTSVKKRKFSSMMNNPSKMKIKE